MFLQNLPALLCHYSAHSIAALFECASIMLLPIKIDAVPTFRFYDSTLYHKKVLL